MYIHLYNRCQLYIGLYSKHYLYSELFDVPLSKYTCPECGGDTSPPVGVVTVQVISVSGLNDRGNLETGKNCS